MSKDDQPDKQSHKKLIVILILVSIGMSVPATMYIFDSVKSPLWLLNDSFDQKLSDGYNLVCDTDKGMSLCMIKADNSTKIAYNDSKLVVQNIDVPPICLNVYSHTSKKVLDSFNEPTNSTTCSASIEFLVSSGWYIVGTVDPDIYFVEKIKQFWIDWWYDL